ncbi:MAG: MBG domain-containing protein [Acidimicrobiales bacterium]
MTVSNASMGYGGSLPALSATFSGPVNGDIRLSESARATSLRTANARPPEGTFPITRPTTALCGSRKRR